MFTMFMIIFSRLHYILLKTVKLANVQARSLRLLPTLTNEVNQLFPFSGVGAAR